MRAGEGSAEGPEGNRPAVFISYTAVDKPWAEWIAWQLREAGYGPRLQAWHSVPAANFVAWIDQELAAAEFVIPVLSLAYLDSDWATAEWQAALGSAVEGKQHILPVRVDSCDTPPLLRQVGRVNLVGLSEDAAHRLLLEGMRTAAAGHAEPDQPPAFPGDDTHRLLSDGMRVAATSLDQPGESPTFPGEGDQLHQDPKSREWMGPSYPGPNRQALVSMLLDRVEQACRLRYPEAAVRRGPAGAVLPYLDMEGQRDGERQRWPVGVSLDTPDEAAVADFFSRVVGPAFAVLDDAVSSELVHTGAPPEPEVLRAARRRRMRVRSLAEFEGRWDPRAYLARQTERLVVDPVYLPDLYVPQRFVVADDPSVVQEDVFSAVLDWLDADDARFLLILGDFGHGKSFLLRELARRMPAELPQVVPMLIELGALEKTHSVDDLLALHLAKAGEDGVSLQAVRRMVDQGRAALLFDGFDELALRVTYDRAAEHLKTVLSAVTGRAKVVLSSRTQHFVTDDQHRTALGDEVRLRAASREIRLADFDASQIREFLVRLFRLRLRVASEHVRAPEDAWAEAQRHADARLELIHSIRDLLGLSANPRMLSFIADLDEANLLDARSADGTISSADLYARLVARWLSFEVSRRQPTRGSYQTLGAGQLRQAVDALAVALWGASEETVDLGGLSDTVQAALTDLGASKLDSAQATFMVGSGSLLVRDEADRFSFVHRSVMEYLVAAVAARQLADDIDAPNLLGVREMSDLMVDFLCGTASRADLQAWAGTVLGDNGAAAAARNNALRVVRRLDLRLAGAHLAGQDLRGQDLNGRDLRFANLAGANLRGVRLANADFTGADLTGADLTEALLVRPVLTEVRLHGSRWAGAALLAPTLDADAKVAPELAVAAIPGRDPVDAMLLPPADTIGTVAWSSANVLAAAWGNNVALLEATHIRPLRILTGHTGRVLVVVFAPDGHILATGSHDYTVRLWEIPSGRQIATLTGYTSPVRSMAFNGRILVTASADGSVRLWDVSARQQMTTLTGQTGRVLSVAFAPNGRTLATGSHDSTVRLWEIPSGRQIAALASHTGPLRSVVFAPRTPETPNRGNSGTSRRTVAAAGTDGTVRLWDVPTRQQMTTLTGHTGRILSVAFTPDGQTLATAGADGTARLWDVATGRQKANLTGHTGRVLSVAFAPDGQTLATGSTDRSIRLWKVPIGWQAADGPAASLTGHTGIVLSVVFAPDRGILATGSHDSTVRLWEVATGRQAATLTGHTGPVRSVAFTPNGRLLATGSHDSTVRLWEVATGRQAATLTGHTGTVTSVAFSPDGRTLATSSTDRSVLLWETATGRQAATLTGHTGPVTSVAFSPDERLFATGGHDSTVRLWETATGRQAATLTGHTGTVTSVAFSPDGRTLGTGSTDNTARMWDVPSHSLVATLLPARRGRWAAILPNGNFKCSSGDLRSMVWWAVKLRRFDADELDGVEDKRRRLKTHDHLPALHHISPTSVQIRERNQRQWAPRAQR